MRLLLGLREQKAEVSWIGFEPSDVYEAESPPSDGASSGVYEEEQPSDGASSGVSRLSEEKQEQPIPPCPEWVPSGVYEEEQEQEQPLAPSQEQLRERFERLMRRSQCRKGPGAGAADVAKDQEQEPPMPQRSEEGLREAPAPPAAAAAASPWPQRGAESGGALRVASFERATSGGATSGELQTQKAEDITNDRSLVSTSIASLVTRQWRSFEWRSFE